MFYFLPYTPSFTCAVSLSLRIIHDVVQLMYPNPFPTGCQHNLVARPRATLVGHGVLSNFDLEIFILLSNIFHLCFNFVRYLLARSQIMCDWMLNHFLSDLLFSFLCFLQSIKFLTRKLCVDILKLIQLFSVLSLTLLGLPNMLQ